MISTLGLIGGNMAITIMGVRRERQYGMGEVWNIDDLSSFGWSVVVKDDCDGKPCKRKVLIKRPVTIGEDALVARMEGTYEAEYEKIAGDIRRQYLIQQFLAFIIGIPTIFIALFYVLSIFWDSFLPLTSALDMGAKKIFITFGEQVAGTLTLGLRFIFLAIAVICIVFFVVNVISYRKRLKNPLRYYRHSAKVIEESLLIAKQRVECIKYNAGAGAKETERSTPDTSGFSEDRTNFNGLFQQYASARKKRKSVPYFETYKMPEGRVYEKPEQKRDKPSLNFPNRAKESLRK